MTSVILNTATRILLPIILLLSLFLLYAGHNEPGGGFAGGLVAAAALGLLMVSRGVPAARTALFVSPVLLLGLGLLLAAASGLVALLVGEPYLTGEWLTTKLGTPLLFDMGVYLVVVGAASMILFELGEE